MNVTVEKLPASRCTLRIHVSLDEARPFLEQAARELSKTNPPKGFRAGAAPFDVMRNVVGDAKLIEETVRHLVPRTYVEALVERPDVEAIGAPDVEVEAAGLDAPWVYRATVAVLPEVTLGDYRGIRGGRRSVSICVEDVERELEQLRKLRASYLTVPRGAHAGDRVEVDVTATVENVPPENGSTQRETLFLGDGYLVPEFEERLEGMKEGERREFPVRFPENHHRSDLRGRTIGFRVTMHTVQQRILPEINDHFAQGLGKFTNLSDLQEKLAAHLREEREAREQERFQQELLEYVTAGTTYGTFPDVLIERELDTMVAELQEGVTGMGLTFDTYLGQIRKSRQELRDGLKPQAAARLRAALALRAIAKSERIAVTEEEVEAEVNDILKKFSDRRQAEQRLDLEGLRDMAAAAVRNRKVFAALETIAAQNRKTEPTP